MIGSLKNSMVKYWVLFSRIGKMFLLIFWKNAYPNFAVNLELVSGKWPDCPKNWYNCSLWYLETFYLFDSWYFDFSYFYGTRKMKKCSYFNKIGIFCLKINIFSSFASRKNTKNKNIKNCFEKKFLNITRSIYTNF